MSFQATTQSNRSISVYINNTPDECPQCHNKGTFSPLSLYYNEFRSNECKLEVIYRCANSKCYETFISYYEESSNPNHFNLKRSEPGSHDAKEFSEIIKDISKDFSDIYNQALKAEISKLDQICGPGYRKALEFLIKDYLTKKSPETSDAIKKEQLGQCIANRIQDINIKEVSRRAAWLGNDEMHYVRKWEQKDLQDLKKLIDLTVHWMEAEALTKSLLEDMPDDKTQ